MRETFTVRNYLSFGGFYEDEIRTIDVHDKFHKGEICLIWVIGCCDIVEHHIFTTYIHVWQCSLYTLSNKKGCLFWIKYILLSLKFEFQRGFCSNIHFKVYWSRSTRLQTKRTNTPTFVGRCIFIRSTVKTKQEQHTWNMLDSPRQSNMVSLSIVENTKRNLLAILIDDNYVGNFS